jgi:hypothetical protein
MYPDKGATPICIAHHATLFQRCHVYIQFTFRSDAGIFNKSATYKEDTRRRGLRTFAFTTATAGVCWTRPEPLLQEGKGIHERARDGKKLLPVFSLGCSCSTSSPVVQGSKNQRGKTIFAQPEVPHYDRG